jgi:hypothetical protein
VRRLLKSCAMPPVIWPSASSLSLAQRVLDLPLLGPVEQSDDGATVLGWIMKNL